MPSSSFILSVGSLLLSSTALASPNAPVHYNGNFSAPVAYSVPGYQSSASLPAYGDNAKSTPCTTSSAKGASSTPAYYGGYPSYPVSSPVKNDYPSYPVSSPVKNDYPSYPVSSPVKNDYPPTTSKATYDDYYRPPVSKTTITTTYTTTYVDICETGYITKTTTFAVTYCPTATPTPGKPNNPPTYGWDTKTTICNKGCGNGPKTVTVTVPCTKCDYVKSTPTPAVPNKPVCNGYDCKDTTSTTTTKVYSTKIITLTKVPVPEAPKSSPPVYGGNKPSSKPYEAPKSTPAKPVSSPVVSKPVVPASSPVVSKPVVPASSPVISKPLVPTGTPGKPSTNGTISISIGSKATPSKTGYAPPVFTGAAAGLQAGGFVAMVGVVAAMVL